MYIDNGRNILAASDLRLAQDYFEQIQQTLDSLHHLLFAGLPSASPYTTIKYGNCDFSNWFSSGWRSPLPSSQLPSLLSPFRETIRSSRSVPGSIPRRGRELPRPSPRISPRSPRLSHPKAPSQIPRLAPPKPLFLPIHASKTKISKVLSQKEPRKERKSALKRECRLRQSMVIR